MANDRRTLLLVADSLEGGLGSVASAQRRWFAAAGWDVVMAATPGAGPPGIEFASVPVPATTRDAAGMIGAGRRLRQVRRAVDPGVTHCHGLRSFAVARLAGARPFVTLHGAGSVASDPPAYGALRRAVRRAIPRAAAGAISAVPGVPGWRFLPHASPRLASAIHQPFPALGSTPTFLWVGRIDEGKPGDEFVHAVAAVARRRPVSGIVAGDGPGLHRLAAMARRIGAPVEFVGRAAPEPLLADAWALCLFSRHEAVSFVAQEAMWAGRPVVASPLPGLRWLIGDAGVLAGSVEDTVSALEGLCDRERAASLGDRAAVRVRALIDPSDPWPAVARMYEAHLSRRTAGS